MGNTTGQGGPGGPGVVQALTADVALTSYTVQDRQALWQQLETPLFYESELDPAKWRTAESPLAAIVKRKHTYNFVSFGSYLVSQLAKFSPPSPKATQRSPAQPPTAVLITKTKNCLTIFNIFLQLLIEILPVREWVEFLKSPPSAEAQAFRSFLASDCSNLTTSDTNPEWSAGGAEFDFPWTLVQGLVQFISTIDYSENTTAVRRSAIQSLVLLCTTQFAQPPASSSNTPTTAKQESEAQPFLWRLVSPPVGASLPVAALTAGLLAQFTTARPPPLTITSTFTLASSVFFSLPIRVTSFLLSSVTSRVFKQSPSLELPPPPSGGMFSAVDAALNARAAPSPLTDFSALLLLILTNYAPPNGPNGRPLAFNPYRQAVRTFQDLTDLSHAADDAERAGLPTGVFRFSYSTLFDALIRDIHQPYALLVLYRLVHGNSLFLAYLESRTDIEALLAPLLEVLYNAATNQPKRIYLILIVLLILTQDRPFCAHIAQLQVKQVRWFKEKNLGSISLAQLVALTLVHAVQVNLKLLKDHTLQMNCLASLANLSAHFEHLHPYCALKLVKLFEYISKRYIRLRDEQPTAPPTAQQDLKANIAQHEEYLQVVLEMFSSMLRSKKLHTNANWVYALVYDQKLFAPFTGPTTTPTSTVTVDTQETAATVADVSTERSRPLARGVSQAVGFFAGEIAAKLRPSDQDVTHDQVMAVIKDSLFKWRSVAPAANSGGDLVFQYEEEENPDEFFWPMIWDQIISSSVDGEKITFLSRLERFSVNDRRRSPLNSSASLALGSSSTVVVSALVVSGPIASLVPRTANC